MARRITLTRDERIVLKETIESDGMFQPLHSAVPDHRLDQLLVKLQHRGLLSVGGYITDEGRRAMAENRQTQPKAVV